VAFLAGSGLLLLLLLLLQLHSPTRPISPTLIKPIATCEQQLSSLGITFPNFSGSNCLLSGQANLTPGLVTGSTLLQVAACRAAGHNKRLNVISGLSHAHCSSCSWCWCWCWDSLS
jgi:hypothetical protein